MVTSGVPGARVPRRRSRVRAGAPCTWSIAMRAGAPSAPLHKLGTEQWARAAQRAAAAVRDVAAGCDLHARRGASGRDLAIRRLGTRPSLTPPVRGNPRSGRGDRPSAAGPGPAYADGRIICGDVGWQDRGGHARGLRRVSQDGRRWCWCPRRCWPSNTPRASRSFADWPVRIEALSRFRSRPAADSVLTGFENGTVDILIATHKLLHADARAHNLGLLIVDRSTALACATRERLKALRVKCSATLTATPIPRTLNLAQGPARAVTDQHAAGAGWPSRPCVQWHG